jgi:mannose-6-phosphate isomerase-like protein (cupin superfamily)
MRQRELIENGSPCFNDFTDRNMQTMADAQKIGFVSCPNQEQCEIKGISCYRTIAKEMANFILVNKDPFEKVIQKERTIFLEETHKENTEFWVFRDGKWQVVMGRENIVEDVVAFARIIIDMKEGERRPFTKDGMRIPVLGLGDQQHNDILDLQDIAGEVTHK